MQDHSWDELLRRIPANYHDGLILSTIAGADLVIQAILHLDDRFVIIRGRTAGSTDGGKTLIIPIQHINYVTFNNRLTDHEVAGIFGNLDANFAAAPAAPAPEDEQTALDDEFELDDVPAQAPAASGLKSAAAAKPSKSVLLAKLRARLAESSKSGGS